MIKTEANLNSSMESLYTEPKKKRVVVTGITGQDGSYMAEYLLENTDHEIIGTARRTSQFIGGNLENVIGNERFRIETLDITDSVAVSSFIQKEQPDYFINFAAQTFVKDSWDHPISHFDTNAKGPLYIMEAVRQYSPHTKIYLAGSSEQWGDVEYSPQDLQHPFKPRSPYGASKCASHLLSKVYRESYGIYVVQGILFNHECFSANTPIITRKNEEVDIIYIRDLLPEKSKYENNAKILTKTDLNIEIWNGKNFTPIKTVSRKKMSNLNVENQKIVCSNTRSGSVETTPNHNLMLEGFVKTPQKECELGQKIEHGYLPSSTESLEKFLTPQFSNFLGMLCGDGYVNEDGDIRFINSDDKILGEFINLTTKSLSDVTFKVSENPSGFGGEGSKKVDVAGHDRNFGKYLRGLLYHGKTKHKKVPKLVLNSCKENKFEFLKGYYVCDGLKKDKCTYEFKSIKTNSPILAQGIILLIDQLTGQSFNINTFIQNDKRYIQVNFHSDNDNGGKGQNFKKCEKELKKVLDISEEKQLVYDIEVDEGYIQAGIGKMIVGNSPRRQEYFVTRKITKAAAKIAKDFRNNVDFKPLELGNTDAKRDWSHAKDFVDGIWLMMNQKEPKDYILSSNETHSVKEFVEKTFQFMDIYGHWEGKGIHESFIENHSGKILVKVNPKFYRPAEVDLLLGDSTPAREELNWSPKYSFSDLVKEMTQIEVDNLNKND